MCSAVMFSQLLTFTGAARALGDLVVAPQSAAAAMLFAMMALPFVLFMFLDQVALMLVLIPIYQPIIKLYELRRHLVLDAVSDRRDGRRPHAAVRLRAVRAQERRARRSDDARSIRASWPFVWIICVGMVVFGVFPNIITLLPRLMGPH